MYKTDGFPSRHHTASIVHRTLPDVPGIYVSAKHHNLLRNLPRPADRSIIPGPLLWRIALLIGARKSPGWLSLGFG